MDPLLSFTETRMGKKKSKKKLNISKPVVEVKVANAKETPPPRVRCHHQESACCLPIDLICYSQTDLSHRFNDTRLVLDRTTALLTSSSGRANGLLDKFTSLQGPFDQMPRIRAMWWLPIKQANKVKHKSKKRKRAEQVDTASSEQTNSTNQKQQQHKRLVALDNRRLCAMRCAWSIVLYRLISKELLKYQLSQPQKQTLKVKRVPCTSACCPLLPALCSWNKFSHCSGLAVVIRGGLANQNKDSKTSASSSLSKSTQDSILFHLPLAPCVVVDLVQSENKLISQELKSKFSNQTQVGGGGLLRDAEPNPSAQKKQRRGTGSGSDAHKIAIFQATLRKCLSQESNQLALRLEEARQHLYRTSSPSIRDSRAWAEQATARGVLRVWCASHI